MQMLTNKAQLLGIDVIASAESTTSKCSFLDDEEMKHHKKCIDTRTRARFVSVCFAAQIINADLNGSYNIIRKVFPNTFKSNGIVGAFAVHPAGFIL